MTSPSTDCLKEAEELAVSLSEAISTGEKEEAAKLSQRLSELCVPVSVNISREAYPQDNIRLKVGVEDAQSDAYIPVTLVVSPEMMIAQLKDKINEDFGFHPALQRWVIGKRLARDRDTLYSHNVRQNGDQAFLFILSAEAAHLTRRQQHQDAEQQCLESIMESMFLVPRGLEVGATGKTVPRPDTQQNRLPQPPKPTVAARPPLAPKPQPSWSCKVCTFLNKPTRPGCEMCGEERPDTYQVPDLYRPDQQEALRLQREDLAMLQYHQSLVEERERNLMSLLETDSHSLVANSTETDCPICFCPLEPGEGATLRDCLHSFCRECLKGTIVNSQDAEVSCPFSWTGECLKGTIVNSQDAEVSCPFMDSDYSCDSKLQDREIKALLTAEEHQRFLELRLSIAESRAEHSFHCQTPDCPGWCIYEDDVNQFYCQLCTQTNCILCKAIHKDMNCKEYQDDLRIRAENDLAAKQTKDLLEGLLQSGEAMKCPRCDVIVQKKDGCDWIRCVMCQTEICWITKQARWGPNGPGDTSGGCKCRLVNNQLCHPNCKNCH